MEVLVNPTPPASRREAAFVGLAGELVCWHCPDLEVRCVPAQATGDLKVLFALDTAATLWQAGQCAQLVPGSYTFVQPDAAFVLSATSGRLVQWRFPSKHVRERHPHADLQVAKTRGASHAGERVLAELVRQLAQPGVELDEGQQHAALRALLEAVGMGPCRSNTEVAQQRVARAMRYIDARLGEIDLAPHVIAAEQGVSRRYLDALFAQHAGESLALRLRRRRLEAAAEALRRAAHDSAVDIAWRYGFRNASHFSRLFRTHFGVSPTQYRRGVPGQSSHSSGPG